MAKARKARLDAELVRRGLARSREQAASLISGGRVRVRGMAAQKAAMGVDRETSIVVRNDDDPGWASRGAHKLLGALDEFDLDVTGKRCLDAGASTGGFTDVLLRRGASGVVAADVGRGLLDWRLRTDERVTVMDKTNARALTADDIGGPVDVVVADLSFISLKLVLQALAACTRPGGDLLPMVKPQFEVGKDRVGSGGVVRDPELRAEAVLGVLSAAAELGLRTRGVVASPLPGPSGNVEFFAWLRRDTPDDTAGDTVDDDLKDDMDSVAELVRSAVARGPK